MERIESIDEVDDLTLIDHFFRYRWVSPLLHGTVIDVACGIGYGSKIILENHNVEKYVGIDIYDKAIERAKSLYETDPRCYFKKGDIYSLDIQDQSIDAVVSFETLEHIDCPERALAEAKRVLRPDGIFIGSVPTASYDAFHDKFHGGNPFHVSRFTRETLEETVGRFFSWYRIYLVRLRLAVEAKLVKSSLNDKFSTECWRDHDSGEELGIFLFVASNDASSLKRIEGATHSFEIHATPSEIYKKYVEVYSDYKTIANLYHELEQIYRIDVKTLNEKYNKLYNDYMATTKLYNDLQNLHQGKKKGIQRFFGINSRD